MIKDTITLIPEDKFFELFRFLESGKRSAKITRPHEYLEKKLIEFENNIELTEDFIDIFEQIAKAYITKELISVFKNQKFYLAINEETKIIDIKNTEFWKGFNFNFTIDLFYYLWKDINNKLYGERENMRKLKPWELFIISLLKIQDFSLQLMLDKKAEWQLLAYYMLKYNSNFIFHESTSAKFEFFEIFKDIEITYPLKFLAIERYGVFLNSINNYIDFFRENINENYNILHNINQIIRLDLQENNFINIIKKWSNEGVTFDEENQLMKTISNNNINTLLSQIKLKINETRRILTQYEQNL